MKAWPVLLLCAALTGHAETIQVVTEATAYSYIQNGKVAGPATEVVERTLRRAGLEYNIAVYPWARAYDKALAEPNVLIYVIARTPAREALFKWIGKVDRIDFHLYKLAERQDIAAKRLADAKRYSIGVIRDDFREQILRQHGFTHLVVTAQNTDAFRQLLNQQIDLVPLMDSDPAYLCTQARVDCNRLQKLDIDEPMGVDIYLAYSRSTADTIVTRTRKAFDALSAEGVVKPIMDRTSKRGG